MVVVMKNNMVIIIAMIQICASSLPVRPCYVFSKLLCSSDTLGLPAPGWTPSSLGHGPSSTMETSCLPCRWVLVAHSIYIPEKQCIRQALRPLGQVVFFKDCCFLLTEKQWTLSGTTLMALAFGCKEPDGSSSAVDRSLLLMLWAPAQAQDKGKWSYHSFRLLTGHCSFDFESVSFHASGEQRKHTRQCGFKSLLCHQPAV